MRRSVLFLFVLLLGGGVSGHAMACDASAFEAYNSYEQRNERVCSVWDGHDFEIHWSEQLPDGSWTPGLPLTKNESDDVAASLAFDEDGNAGVVWRESGAVGRIMYRGRKESVGSGLWQPAAVLVSDGLHDASAPAVTFAEGVVWVGWHERDFSGTRTVRGGAAGGPDPWPVGFQSELIALTSFDGDLKLDIHAKQGQIWMVWIHETDGLGFAERLSDGSGWSSVDHEPLTDPGEISAAKQRVEDRVIGELSEDDLDDD